MCECVWDPLKLSSISEMCICSLSCILYKCIIVTRDSDSTIARISKKGVENVSQLTTKVPLQHIKKTQDWEASISFMSKKAD